MPCSRQPYPDSGFRDCQGIGDFARRQPRAVAQDNHFLVVGGKVVKGFPQGENILGLGARVIHRSLPTNPDDASKEPFEPAPESPVLRELMPGNAEEPARETTAAGGQTGSTPPRPQASCC